MRSEPKIDEESGPVKSSGPITFYKVNTLQNIDRND